MPSGWLVLMRLPSQDAGPHLLDLILQANLKWLFGIVLLRSFISPQSSSAVHCSDNDKGDCLCLAFFVTVKLVC